MQTGSNDRPGATPLHAGIGLGESERQFRLLVQGVTDYAIYMLDPTGRIASWNAGGERIKGYAADEIIGQHFSRFYTDEDRARDPRRCRSARSAGRWPPSRNSP